MTAKARSEQGFSKPLAIFSLSAVAIVIALFFFRGNLRRFVRESFMQRVTSAHYELLCPPAALSPDAMRQFAQQRESVFTDLDKKLGDAGSNVTIRIVFDPNFPELLFDERVRAPYYEVSGTTIRSTLDGQKPQLSPAADAEALLFATWGKPGNAQLARWTAIWLVGDWRGAEIGMAAAQVEQRLGHKKLASLLVDPGGEISSPDDQTLLGAAWVSEIAEFGGTGAVRKLYAAKMSHPNVAEVT
jgi:hypothetical protein